MTKAPAKTDNNLKIWNQFPETDPKYTKPIKGKSYKGDSVNPTYVVRELTRVLGPIGEGWGYEVIDEQIHLGKPHMICIEQTETYQMVPTESDKLNRALVAGHKKYEIVREQYHQIRIRFWHGDKQAHSFEHIGGTQLLYMANSGQWIHDEDAAKKSLTDALTKAASMLGVSQDIFMGIFDNKLSGDKPTDETTKGSFDERAQQENIPQGTRKKTDF